MSEPTWTPSEGKALVLRTCRIDDDNRLLAHGDFEWPTEIGATVVPITWDPAPRCGYGLHGLLWGQGSPTYLGLGPSEEGNVFMVVEVIAADCVWIDRDKVKFPSCTIVHIGTFAECAGLVNEHAPMREQFRQELREATDLIYQHKTFAIDLGAAGTQHGPPGPDTYGEDDTRERIEMPVGPLANGVSSEVVPWRPKFSWPDMIPESEVPPQHTLMLDIDMPVRVLDSSTTGHHHLVIDRLMPWADVEKVLDVLVQVGIVEPGYAAASKARKATFLRTPWTNKDGSVS
jgi:hypothetical protein